jgi:hypothetical protein
MTAEASSAAPDTNDARDANPAALVGLVDRAKLDPGSPFEPATLNALAALRDTAPGSYERTISGLKSAGIRISKLEHRLDDLVGDGDEDRDGERDADLDQGQAVKIVHALLAVVDLFHNPDGLGYFVVDNGQGGIDPVRIESGDGVRLIRNLYYQETKQIAARESISAAQSILEHKARIEGPERKLYIRVAGHGGKIYVDLLDNERRVVEISADEWRIISNREAPVLFLRRNGMKPLPVPTAGGDILALQRHVNFATKESFILFIAALTYALRPRGPYPLVSLYGEHGTAKSTTAIIFRMFVDPSVAMLRTLPKSEDDLIVAASNCWVQTYDNLSRVSREISDSLCRLLTGGGMAKRALYTDGDQFLVDLMRPVVVTSIPDIAERGDLADRALMLQCATIPEAKRKTEAEFWAAFKADYATIFGAVLDVVVAGLANLPTTDKTGLARMADFHWWGRAIQQRIGDAGCFDRAYGQNRDEAVEAVIESDIVARILLRWLRGVLPAADGVRRWNGTATSLRSAFVKVAGDHAASLERHPEFPKNARALSSALRRLAPALRQIGIDIAPGRGAAGSNISIIAAKEGKFASFASFASPAEAQSNDGNGMGSQLSDANRPGSDANFSGSDANPHTPGQGAMQLDDNDNSSLSDASDADDANPATSVGLAWQATL